MRWQSGVFAVTWCLLLAAWATADEPLVFRDVSAEAGLRADLEGMHAHGAAWGDATGNGWPDLYVGSFHKPDGVANRLFFNDRGQLKRQQQAAVEISGRANSILFVDFNNSGRLDLYVSNLGGGRSGAEATVNKLFRNDGNGRFTDISEASGACPPEFRGRGATVADLNGNGLLDLVLGEANYYGSPRRSRVLFNRGDYRFEDVTDEVGLPPGIPGLGTATGDLTGNGAADVLLTGREESNRLFLNDGQGRFREAPGTRELLAWEYTSGDDSTAGVTFADVNNDGLPDIVIGHHYKQPWVTPQPIRLYLNRGVADGVPRFEDVTERAGLVPLPMKAPHVEIQDFDNDGRPDILVSIVMFAGETPHPVIFRNLGNTADGIPRFEAPALAVNDFPTEEDRQTRRSGVFFEKMLNERKVVYTAAGPVADFDRDGRLDVLISSWWPESPSLLLKNETQAGHWLRVFVEGPEGVNRQGIGAVVRAYEAGRLGEAEALIVSREISIGDGYASGQVAAAHIGLADRQKCDLEIVLPHHRGTWQHRDVEANQEIVVHREGLRVLSK